MDPQLADDTYSLQVVRDMYEGLTSEDRSGHVVPGVAKSWDVNEAGTEYTFHLRPEAKWSDGRAVVADEFVQGLRRAVDPKTASGNASLVAIIKSADKIIAGRKSVTELGVIAPNADTVQITLEHPAPFLLEILAQPIAAPLHNVSQPSIRPITNGPYYLVTRTPGSSIDLAKNAFYWDAANVLIQKIRYLDNESETTELREYLAGQLDLTYTIPMPDLQRITSQHPFEVQSEPFLGTVYLALNLSSGPLKSDTNLRKALSMSLDRETIDGTIMAGVTPAYRLVAQGIQGYLPASYEWLPWTKEKRVATARSLYAKSGYGPANPLHLKLYFNRDEGIHRLMVAVAGSWKQTLGIESELISDEFRVFLAGRKEKHRWDVIRIGWTADYNDPSSFLDIFANSNSEDDSGYMSSMFNSLMASAKQDPVLETRMALLHDAETVLLNDYPIIPIYFYRARRLVKPYVGGAELTPMNRTYSKHLFWKEAA